MYPITTPYFALHGLHLTRCPGYYDGRQSGGWGAFPDPESRGIELTSSPTLYRTVTSLFRFLDMETSTLIIVVFRTVITSMRKSCGRHITRTESRRRTVQGPMKIKLQVMGSIT